MSTTKDFKTFYRNELLPIVQNLEKERKKFVNYFYLALGGLVLILVFTLIANAFSPEPVSAVQPVDPYANQNLGPQPAYGESTSKGAGAFLYTLIAGGLAYYFLFLPKKKSFLSRAKKELMSAMVKHVNEALTYDFSSGISRSEYRESGIFVSAPDRFTSQGLVSGTIDKTSIRFSEIHSESEDKSEQPTSNKEKWKSYNTLFKGTLFIADFNKSFKGRTVVLTDRMEKTFGNIGALFQKMNITRDQLIKLDNPEFEKAFAVYGTDSVETHYILSPALMERIVTLKYKAGNVELSFVGSRIYVAIPSKGNSTQLNVFSTINSYPTLESYYNNLKLVAGIVDDFDLNTRIWTKE